MLLPALALICPLAAAIPFPDTNALALRDLGIPVSRSSHELVAVSRSRNSIVGRSVDKSTPLFIYNNGEQYAVNLTIDSQTYPVLIDTGSNSFWLPSENFTCADVKGTVVPKHDCSFAAFGPREFSGGVVPNENFNVTYVDGEFAVGRVGLQDVTIAGLTVKNQKMALVDRTHWFSSNNLTSGIMGLGLGNYTGYFKGSDPTLDNKTDPEHTWVPAKTWHMNAYDQGLIEAPVFSVNLGPRGLHDKNLSTTGSLTFGGAPIDGIPYTGTWVSSVITPETYAPWGVKDQYVHYTIRPEGFTIDDTFITWKPGNWANTTDEVFTILDLGANWSYVTNETVQVIAAKMQPPATWNETDFAWTARCGATVPNVSLRVNGTDLRWSPREILLDGDLGHADGYTDKCWLGIQPAYVPVGGGSAPYILGNTFLRNVVTVHDAGNMKVTLGSVNWD